MMQRALFSKRPRPPSRRDWDLHGDSSLGQDETGERFWIYRAGDGNDATTGAHLWFLHGIFG